MRVKAKTWGVIGKNYTKFYPNPYCKPYSSPHQVPKHKMLWYIEKGTLREVGKIDA